MTILYFLIMLSAIVVVHEYGHYKVAVLCGVKVLKFSVGFGKPLIAWQLHPFKRVKLEQIKADAGSEINSGSGPALNLSSPQFKSLAPDPSKTIFLLSSIPLGGYVQMLDEREGGVDQELIDFAFNRKPLKARAAIVAAGPLANLLLAIFLYACVQWVGQLQPSAVVGTPLAGSIVEQADLRSGDRILGLRVGGINSDFQVTPTYRDFVNLLIEAKARSLSESPSLEAASSSVTSNTYTNNPQWVEIAVNRDNPNTVYSKADRVGSANAPRTGVKEDGPTERADTTIELQDILNMPITQTLRFDLNEWRVSEHLQSSAQERVQALRDLGLTGPKRSPVVNSLVEGGVAKKAGVLPGDEVVKINGLNVSDAQDLVQMIRKSFEKQGSGLAEEQKLTSNWEIRRIVGGQVVHLNLRVIPRTVQEYGKSIGRVDAIIGGEQELVYKRLGFWAGMVFASQLTIDQANSSLGSFKSMVLGQLSWHELSGPLSLAEYAGKTAQGGLANFVSFVAFVSVSVGILNLMPIPVLDGGQLMYYLWELLSGSAPSEVWSARLTQFGLATVILMMCVAMFNDVVRLIG